MSSETRIPLHGLNQPCSQLLEKVLRRLLCLSTTQQAIAEIIDDMPISSHYFGLNNIFDQPHPDIQHRLKPSSRAEELASKLCETLDPLTLPVDAKVSFLPQIHWSFLDPRASPLTTRLCLFDRLQKTSKREYSSHPMVIRLRCVFWRFPVS